MRKLSSNARMQRPVFNDTSGVKMVSSRSRRADDYLKLICLVAYLHLIRESDFFVLDPGMPPSLSIMKANPGSSHGMLLEIGSKLVLAGPNFF